MVAEIPAGTFTVTASDYPAIIKPVTVAISIHTGKDGWVGWIGENEDLGIRAAVSSHVFKRWKWWNARKLKRSTIEDIDYLVDSYLVQGKDNVTEDLRCIIQNWKGYADPAKRPGTIHWREAILVEAERSGHGVVFTAECPACHGIMRRQSRDARACWTCDACRADFVENDAREIAVASGKGPGIATKIMLMDYPGK
jgi:hypothetical protein